MGQTKQFNPWLNDEAIEFLQNFIEQNPNAKILEFGSGGSTVWFSQRTKFLTSIEHNKEWFNFVNKSLLEDKNCNSVCMRLIEQNYYEVCSEFSDEYFDIILVDGVNRKKCIKASIRILKQGGVLMLDNAERPWYNKIYSMLNNWQIYKTLQVRTDLSGNATKLRQTNWWIKPYKLYQKDNNF